MSSRHAHEKPHFLQHLKKQAVSVISIRNYALVSPLDKPGCFWGKQWQICLNKKKLPTLHYQLRNQQLDKIKQSTRKPHGDSFSFCFAFLLVWFCFYSQLLLQRTPLGPRFGVRNSESRNSAVQENFYFKPYLQKRVTCVHFH